MNRALPRPVLAALVLPLVVIVGFQSAWAAFACTVDGKVRDYSCCKAQHQGRAKQQTPADDGPRMAARSCCELTIYDAKDAPVAVEAERAVFEHVPTVIVTVAYTLDAPRVERLPAFAQLARPPPPRVPLFLDKHALLR